tara:strand:+ start:4215 stop:4751 length:537 start_codon:yes stop_codon:yes gene_type:complete
MNRKGQIWVETVLYTLIGLALIGMVLAFIMPKINESKDQLIIEQSIESLNVFDDKVNVLLERGAGNVRNVEFNLKRGELYFNSEGDEISLVLSDIENPITEPGVILKIGRVGVKTEIGQKANIVNLTLSYPDLDIRYLETDIVNKKFNPSSIPYEISLSNRGDRDDDGLIELEIKEIS